MAEQFAGILPIKMVILVDLDSVLADFEEGFLRQWRKKYPKRPYLETAERLTFYVEDQYPPEYRRDITELKRTPGFFRSLPLVDGAKAALLEMAAGGHQVFICSAPLSSYQHCVEEKYQWVEKNLGADWVKKLIIAKDKTLVRGDILIDDRPEITGCYQPSWRHFLFDSPSNMAIKTKDRLNWSNWREKLGL